MVQLGIGGAEPVVQAVGVFPPAQNLADHPLQAGQGHGVGSVGRRVRFLRILRLVAVGGCGVQGGMRGRFWRGACRLPTGLLQALDHLKRMQQPEVDEGGEQRMPEGGLAAHHRILIRAEAGKAGGNEVLQHRQGLLAAHRPAEGLQITRQWSEPAAGPTGIEPPHLGDHRQGDDVRLKPQRRWTGQPLGGGAAVVMVVVPLAAEGRGAGPLPLHQDAEAPPPLAIEQLHAQLAAAVGPSGEVLAAPQKGVGGMPDQGGWRGQGGPRRANRQSWRWLRPCSGHAGGWLSAACRIKAVRFKAVRIETDWIDTVWFKPVWIETGPIVKALFETGLHGTCQVRTGLFRTCQSDDPLQGLTNRPVGRLHRVKLRDAVLRAPGMQGNPEAFRLAVVHLPARLAQLGHEVA